MKERWLGLVVIFAFIPLLQWGGNSVFSMSFIAYCVFILGTLDAKGVRRGVAYIPVIAFVFILPYFDLLDPSQFWSMVGRSVREILVLYSLLAISLQQRRFGYLRVAVQRYAPYLAFLAVFFLGVQFVSLRFGYGHLFFLPLEYFGSIEGGGDGDKRVTTVASYWLEHGVEHDLFLGDDFKVRPSAWYAEPSYLGFVLFSLYVLFSHSGARSSRVNIFFALCCLGMFLSETLSGLVAILVYRLFQDYSRFSKRPLILILGVVFFTIALVVGGGGRIFTILVSGDDVSSYGRLVLPFVNMAALVESGMWFGVHSLLIKDFLSEALSVSEVWGLDNALLNFFQFHGVGALVLFFIARRVFNSRVLLYTFLACFFNGSLLSFDKGFLIALVIVVVSTALSKGASVQRSSQADC